MKHTKKIIAALLALTMTACSDTGTVEETTVSESITSEAVHTEESVLTNESKTESEITTEAETTTTAEVTTTEETTTAVEVVTEVDSEGNTVLKMTADTKFYECELTDENSVTSAEEFEDKELLDKAITVFNESDIPDRGLAFHEYYYNEAKERGEEYEFPECELINAITTDFNGDGKEETAFFFFYPLGTMEPSNFLLFADSSGNVSIIDEFDFNVEMKELKYSGFSHLAVSGGGGAVTMQARIYSVHEDGLKEEFYSGFGACLGCVTDVFSLDFYIHGSRHFHIFWNNDLKCYVTPKAKYLSRDEAEKIKNQIDLSQDEKNVFSECDVIVIGNKYFTLYEGDGGYNDPYLLCEYSDGKYERCSDKIFFYDDISRCASTERSEIGYIDDFDFETAEKNLVKIG